MGVDRPARGDGGSEVAAGGGQAAVTTVDWLVVGAGAAGLLAALEAASRGLSTALLEARDAPGGMSALAVGSVTAAATRWQRRAGIADTPEDHLAEWCRSVERRTGAAPRHADLARVMVSRGAGLLDLLEAHGIAVSGPHPEPDCNTVPRMHNLQGGGRALMALGEAAAARGVAVCPGQRVVRLLQHGGRVTGVVAAGDAGRVQVWMSRRGVLLATGPNAGEQRLMALPDDRLPEAAAPFLCPFDRGDGHLLAMTAGGALLAVGTAPRVQLRTVEQPHLEPNAALARAGVWLNLQGEPVPGTGGEPAAALLGQSGQAGYLLWGRAADALLHHHGMPPDGPYGRDGWVRAGRLALCTCPGIAYAYVEDGPGLPGWRQGDDLPGLLRSAGLPDAAAGRTAERAGGGPYVLWGPFRAVVTMDKTALRVDERLRVLDGAGRPVPGLWAAGGAAYIDPAPGHGLGLAWALASGQAAAADAASA